MVTEGKWFCAIEGIAIADKIYNFYFEEYSNIPQNKNVGDLDFSVISYRLFCDFDGLPIKRNRFKLFNAEYCTPITAKYKNILRKSIKDHPQEYASFEKFLNTKQVPKGHKILRYALSKDAKNKAIQDLKKIKHLLPPKFTFQDILKAAADTRCIVDLANFVDDTFGIPLSIQIILSYTYGNHIGKRILFNDLDFEIKGNLSY